ncbi:hypothetical protein SAMN05216480_10427 [Pustulibacterium marinum]|uniref:Lipoprotein n=1 Tax=Pustulibacterium marinum TaxID=1224947 RepID=A0A1I7GAX5_9FLAO|nr:hypothetical protein [Pustulibacterium marinum]SFU45396.1 hypothetical protein SAMN05216480_10427 [Pustulibacterium marinum]
MKKLLGFGVLVGIFISLGCSCPPPKKHKDALLLNLEIAECVFIGDVIAVDSLNHRFTVRVTESLDGGDAEGNIYEGSYGDCNHRILKKEKWIFYGGYSGSDYFSPIGCGISRPYNSPKSTAISELLILPPPPDTYEQVDFSKYLDSCNIVQDQLAHKLLMEELHYLRTLRDF